MVRYLYNGDIR